MLARTKLMLHSWCPLIVIVLAWLVPPGSAFLASRSYACLEEPFKCQNIYDGINYFLMSEVPTDDVGENMAAIEAWINRMSSHSLTKSETSRLSALVLISSLRTTDGPGRCHSSTAQLLYANDIALKQALSKLEPGQQPKRRLEKVVYHYANAYIRDCDLEAKLKRFSTREMQNIKDFIGELIGSHAKSDKFFMFQSIEPTSFVESQPKSAATFAKSMKSIGTRRDITIIYRWLQTIATRDEDPLVKYLNKVRLSSGELAVDRLNIYNMIQRHLTKPCENYVNRFEPFFRSRWTISQSRKLHKKLGNEEELDKQLAYYYGCKKFLLKESYIVDRVEMVVKSSNLVSGARHQKL